jgi:hypothetical protein
MLKSIERDQLARGLTAIATSYIYQRFAQKMPLIRDQASNERRDCFAPCIGLTLKAVVFRF